MNEVLIQVLLSRLFHEVTMLMTFLFYECCMFAYFLRFVVNFGYVGSLGKFLQHNNSMVLHIFKQSLNEYSLMIIFDLKNLCSCLIHLLKEMLTHQ